MATIQDILGGGLPPGLLTPEQEAVAQQRAQNAGLLNLAFGLLQGSRGQPGMGKPSLGQVVGQAGPMALQGYQQSFDQTLQNALRGMQVQEMRRKQAEEERVRQARQQFEQRLAGATTQVPSLGITPGGQQESMLAQQMEGFAPEDMAGTRQALFSAGATRPQVNQVAADAAVMDYLRVASPLEYAKIQAQRGGTEYEKVDLGNSIVFVDKRDPTKIVSTIPKGQDTGKTNETELKIYDDFSKAATPYVGIAQAYKKIEASSKNPSAAGDLSLIFNYMKILDPQSVVREGEFATAQNATGVASAIRNLYNRVASGERLNPDQRQDFLNQARNLIESQKNLFDDSVLPRFETQIKNYKLNRENIIFNPFAGIDFTKSISPSEGGTTPSQKPAQEDRRNKLRSTLFPNRGG